MRKARKAALSLLCACALVAGSVAATVAYLTDEEAVENTFTVGTLEISLDEADTDDSSEGDRDKANEYKLIPGQTYAKDPTVHFPATNEAAYLFVKVENGIAAIEAEAGDGYEKVAAQIVSNGWTLLEDDVYYRTAEAADELQDFQVFEEFKISGAVDNATLAGYATEGNAESVIAVTAYAVQKAGFETAADAWGATFGK